MDVEGVGKSSVFQNDESTFYEWTQKIEDYLIGIEPHIETMLSCALENETEIRQSMIADNFGENGDPTKQVDGRRWWSSSKLFWHIQQKEKSQSIVQNCGRNGMKAWRGPHKRCDPLIGGRRRNLLRAAMTPPRVKMEELGSALHNWKGIFVRHNQKNAKVGEVEYADDIKCSAVESMVPENLERHSQLNAGRLKKDDDVRVEIYAQFESCSGKIVRP